MIEPKFVSKEELERRKHYVENSRNTMRDLRKERLEKVKNGEGVSELDDRINYLVSDIATSMRLIEKDEKDLKKWEKWAIRKEYQQRSMPTADRESMAWTEEEIKQCEDIEYDNDDILKYALKLHRTFYSMEHIARTVEAFRKNYNMDDVHYSTKMTEYLSKQLI